MTDAAGNTPPDGTDFTDTFVTGDGSRGTFFSLPKLEAAGYGPVSSLPVSIRVVLESLLRHVDGSRVTGRDVRALASWEAGAARTQEVPFVVSRVLLQDFTGVPLGVDLASMRSAVRRTGRDPSVIEPLVPVDLVIDHSVQVDFASRPDAMKLNLDLEFKRNRSRYQFLKWCMGTFERFRVVPPGFGICHQVNLEYLAPVVASKENVYFFDTLVGTDSHTTMVNGLGVLGWGVGGIEAEAAMLGQPVYLLTPDVVGVKLLGRPAPGATATDVVLAVTELLRKTKVVGSFVEFFGEGAALLTGADRATIANMAPEYGATAGYFPVDEATCDYLLATGRDPAHVATVRAYCEAQGVFGVPRDGVRYTRTVELDLGAVVPSVAGPKRPQDRTPLNDVKARFTEALTSPAPAGYGVDPAALGVTYTAVKGDPAHGTAARGAVAGGGSVVHSATSHPVARGGTGRTVNARSEVEMLADRPTPDRILEVLADDEHASALKTEFPATRLSLRHGDVLIAAITSCTNTSNPSVMLGAGILARKAVARGLEVGPKVKASLAPGSRVVTDYLERTGLQGPLDALGFTLVGYGCTTCIGNSGPLDPAIEELLHDHDVVGVSVLSGNRNFEARVHQSIKANFLMSPPLVVAYALAGNVLVDFAAEPLGTGSDGRPVYLRDVWPTPEELSAALAQAADPGAYRRLYSDLTGADTPWDAIPASSGAVYDWDPQSTYIQEPPYFERFGVGPEKITDVVDARPLAVFGDSVTTDHISPAGNIKASSPAGIYLKEHGVTPEDFNSYGSRRGNHHVMVRGTFANVRIRNKLVPGTEGGVTLHRPSGDQMSIYDASVRYKAADVPLVVFAGQEYGTGSSRDWAAKGTRLLGVKAVVAESFERIHRSNLVGMGVLPLQLVDGVTVDSLGLTGEETVSVLDLEGKLVPQSRVDLIVRRGKEAERIVPVLLRIDTPIEVEYYRHGGILPFVLRQLTA